MLNSPEYTWETLEVGEDIPSPRAGHSICYNEDLKQLILFGGASHESGPSNETFFFDLSTKSWEMIKLPAHCPSPRYEHACISLPGEMLVMFGAQVDGVVLFIIEPLNDVWSLNLGTVLTNKETKEWSLFQTRGKGPSARVLRSVGFTPDTERIGSRLYVFGGGLLNNVPVNDRAVYCLDLG